MAPQPPFAASGIQETAERFRRAVSSLLAPHGGIGQVTTAWPTPMQVTAHSPASLVVNVQPGEVWVPGTLSTEQGQYYCLAAETRVLTREGVFDISDLVGDEPELLTLLPSGMTRWVRAPIKSFGVQRLQAVTMTRNRVKKVIHATAEHRWLLRESKKRFDQASIYEKLTTQLRRGDRLAVAFPYPGAPSIKLSSFGVAHGLVFGDGTNSLTDGRIDLWGDSIEMLKYFPEPRTSPLETDNGVVGIRVLGLPFGFKDLPTLSESKGYLYGWLAGYFAADGCVDTTGHPTIASVDRHHLEYVRLICNKLGIGTFGVRSQKRIGYFSGEPEILHSLGFIRKTLDSSFFLLLKHRQRFDAGYEARRDNTGWVVESVEETDRVEQVFCAVVPGTHNFVLEDNIVTGNCFNDAVYAINLATPPSPNAGDTGVPWAGWTAPSAGNSQIIVIVATVYDTDYSFSFSGMEAAPWAEFWLQPIFGTAASTPSFPTLPQNSIALANFTVTSSTTAITSGMITDARIPSAFANLPGAVPIGGEVAYYGGALPFGFLLEDNASYPQSQYPSLYAVIGTTYNQSGDSPSSFRTPDSRGRATIGAGTGPGLTARTLGQGAVTALQSTALGEENHDLLLAELANHNHPDAGHSHGKTGDSHSHGVTDHGHGHSTLSTSGGLPVIQSSSSSLGPVGAGGGVASSTLGQTESAFAIGSHTTGVSINAAGSGIVISTGNAANAAAGSGTGHNTVQPSLVATKMIRAF